MITVEEARAIIIRAFHEAKVEQKTERIDLSNALGRVLAEAVVADRDQPPFDRSIRDGFTLRSADTARPPCVLTCVGEIKAGDHPSFEIRAGEAAHIMTGAMLPRGADAVLMIEEAEILDERNDEAVMSHAIGVPALCQIRVARRVQVGESVSRRGSEARMGAEILARGRRIRPHEIALLASVGKSSVHVFRQPRVAILATGDELVAIDEVPRAVQIRNSNSHSIRAQVERAGGLPRVLGVARDERKNLRAQVQRGLKEDCLIVTGGVSAGKYDLVESALAEFEMKVLFDSVSVRPGKPAVFGRASNKFVFGLPGNPVSSIVTFELFVKPLLELLSGAELAPPRVFRARLEKSVNQKPGRRAYLPALATWQDGNLSVCAVEWHGSADLVGLARANCFLIIPDDSRGFAAGAEVEVLFVD